MKSIICIIFVCFSFSGFSQSMNVQTAGNYATKDPKNFVKAKEYIDLAYDNPSTNNDPKMWYYRGLIYLGIYRDTTELGKNNPDAIEKSAISFMNCLKTDKGKYYEADCNRQIWITGVGLFNKASEAYRAENYERASKFYTLIFDVIPFDKDNNMKRSNVTAESVYKNLYFVARKTNDVEKQKAYLQKLIDLKNNDPTIYSYMSRIYLEQKDTVKAVQYIDQGRSLFEDNTGLMTAQISLYAVLGRTDELIDRISKAIEGGQETEFLYFTRATLYQSKKENDKAVEDFKKAIELKPDFTEAYYRLGVIYFNEAGELVKSANTAKTPEESEKIKTQFLQKFQAAQPYLEKALEINPKKTDDDISIYTGTFSALKQIYARTNQMDKYNALMATSEKK